MKTKMTLHLVVLAALLFVAAPVFAQVSHKFPATDTNNVWTGKNSTQANGQIIATDAPYDFSFNLEQPTPADSGIWKHRIRRATSPVEITCNTVGGGTATVNIELRSLPNIAGSDMLQVPLSCDENENVSTDFLITTIPARSYLALKIVAASAPFIEVHMSVQPQ